MAETGTAIAIQIAISVALSLVTALLTPKQKLEGPRLKDKRFTTSGYGEPIPVCFGTNRLFGNVIWGTDIEEVARTDRLGKGSLLSPGTQTTYTYFANFAVAFGEGEAFGVVKIYADGQLIYDAEDETGEGGRTEGLKFRFYTGSQTQDPDPLIQEDVDGREGANSTPAFRGITYIVFERLPLAEFGNRIPQIEAVIAWKGDNALRVGVEAASDEIAQVFTPRRTVVDLKRNIVYAVKTGSAGGTLYLTAHSLRDGQLLASREWLDVLAEMDPSNQSGWNNPATSAHWPGNLSGNDGDYLFAAPTFGNSIPIGMIEKATLAGKAVFGTLGTGYNTRVDGFTGGLIQMATVPIRDAIGQTKYVIAGGGTDIFNDTNLWLAERSLNGSFGYLWGKDNSVGSSDVVVGIQAGPEETGARWIYFATRTGSTGPLTIRRVRVLIQAYYDTINDVTIGVSGPDTVYTQTSGTNGSGLVAMAWDEIAGGLLISDPGNGSGLLNVDTGAFVWFEAGADGQSPYSDQVGLIASGGVAWPTVTTNAFEFRDVETGEVVDPDEFNWSDTFTSGGIMLIAGATGPVWDARLQRAYAIDNTNSFVALYGDRITGASDTLTSVVTRLATRGALSASDIDVSGLSGTVRGYKIERQSSIRDVLAPLGVAYNFDAAEVGGVIEFKHRDGASNATIAETDLVPDKDGVDIKEMRGQEIEAPLAVSIEYVSPDRDYQSGTQIVRRIQSPVPVVNSNSESVVQLPIALSDQQATETAERALFQAWIEREKYAFSVSAQFLRVVPNDVLTVTADGQTRTMRAQRVSVGADSREIEIEAVASESFVYTTGFVPVSASLPVPQQVPGNYATLTPHAFDIPFLRDADDSGASALIYVAASREVSSSAAFGGANISVASSGGAYESRAFVGSEATYFAAVTALADPPDDEFYSIHDTSFAVRLVRGTAPSTVTDAQLIGEDANTLAVFNEATQGWEIIGARDVTDNGDGTYVFSGIFRSKRGSETHAFGHAAGARVVLLTAGTVEAYTTPTSTLAGAAGIIANEAGQPIEDGGRVTLTYRLESLKPYAPVQVAAAWDGSDIDLSWVRRTRLNGGWIDGTGTVPVSEEAESYEIDIYSGPTTGSPAGTVLRTLTSTTTAATYTAAQIASDFGSPAPSELTVKVYQVSAAVGRGFALEKTIEVT